MILHYEFDLNVDELGLSTLGDSRQGFPKRVLNDGIEFFIIQLHQVSKFLKRIVQVF